MPSLKREAERRPRHHDEDLVDDLDDEDEEYEDDEELEDDGQYDTSRMPLRSGHHRRPMSGHSTQRSRSLSRTGSRMSTADPLVS